jgi:hypothetical protein
MIRDAKLYILLHRDWQTLAALFEDHKDHTLKLDITIFQLMGASSVNQQYAILTLSDRADKIVEKYGAILASDKDLLRISLHSYLGQPLYGDKINLTFLKKL